MSRCLSITSSTLATLANEEVNHQDQLPCTGRGVREIGGKNAAAAAFAVSAGMAAAHGPVKLLEGSVNQLW